ncbi:MAG: hypothetical protein JNK92_10340 [Dechloromonas sp.]|nr:hypothetical protein [Dechloromonas sp.]
MDRIFATIAAALLLLQPVAAATGSGDPERRSERVHFAKGATATVIKGQIKGYQYVDYRLRAGAGQTLSVEMKTGNAANYFNILPPGSGDVAMFVGSMSGNRFSGVLPTDGDYAIRVYLMRNAARRNESARFALTLDVSGKALPATPAAEDALIPGTPFHASAKVVCTVPFAPKVKECDAFVIRRGFDGTATVEVRWGEGMKRRILFVRHEVVAADSTEAPVFERGSDFTIVRFGSDERFEIPEALVTGG